MKESKKENKFMSLHMYLKKMHLGYTKMEGIQKEIIKVGKK